MRSGRLQVALAGLLAVAPALAASPTIFSERALDFVHFNGMSGQFYFPEVVGSGGALFDYDNDGDLDLYLIQGRMLGAGGELSRATLAPHGPLTDRLYRNDLEIDAAGRRSVTFTDVTEASGLTADAYGMGAAVADYDGDGWLDLYVTNFGPNQLWRNLGKGADGSVKFAEVTARAGVEEPRWSVPATFFDLDRDGWLDLYVGNYVSYSVARNKSCVGESGLRDYCGPQSYEPETDRLFRNRGNGTFEDWTTRLGWDREPGATLGATAADFNGDGWLDLYVANDQTANRLWLNQGQGEDGKVTLVDDALLMGCALNRDGKPEASMGVDAADFDGDGDEDLFMTHLNRESNTLYVNDGKGLFRDRSSGSGLANPSWAYTGFGTVWLDYDNDGWLDLFAANGAVYIIFELARDEDPFPLHQRNQLFRNLGPGSDGVRFEEVSANAGPAFERSEVSRGVPAGDVDNDGDVDLVVVNNSGTARLLINQVGQSRPWLGLRPVAGDPARDQPGTRVAIVRDGAPTLWRRVRTDGSFSSASDPRVLVGLGDSPKIERVEVHWPDGAVERWTGLALGEYHTLHRGTGETPGTPAAAAP